MAVRDEALKWWSEKIQSAEHVVSGKQIKDQRRRALLVKERLLSSVARGFYVLKKPEDEIQDVVHLLYWQIVRAVLSRYKWSVRGTSAVLIYTGDERTQGDFLVRTKEKTNWKISLVEGLEISLRHDPKFDERLTREVEVAGTRIPADIPEKVLIEVSNQFDSKAKSFVAGTQFHARTLEALYAEKPRPIVFKRLAGAAMEAGRLDLVAELERIIAAHTPYQVGKREKVAPDLVTPPVSLAPAWVVRQQSQFKEFDDVLQQKLGSAIDRLKKHHLDTLVKAAREHKKYDTYHSTTLEGYRIKPEEVDALLSGLAPKERKGEEDRYIDEVRNRMAILGYAAAFDFILEKAEIDSGRPVVTEGLMKDACFHLFEPSADAGIIDYPSLVSYRNAPAFIRGTSYVPPGHGKLADLMSGFEGSVNEVNNPIVRAILAHYFFVTIHPYVDGNGRTARLLMNYLLIASGYSWLTIRADQRAEYFDALKRGQLQDDILPFGKLVVEMLAATAAEKRGPKWPRRP